MDELAGLRGPRCPVFSLHDSIIAAGSAKWDSVSLIVRSHPDESVATNHLPFEMVDVRRLGVWARRLIVIAELIEPGYRVGICAAIEGVRF